MAKQARLFPQGQATQRARECNAGLAGVRHYLLPAVVAAVTLLCAGCSKIVVPDLTQQDLDQAKQTLTAAKLKTGNIMGAQGAPPPGSYVTDQNPKPGQKVAANTPIDLQVETPVTVPDLTNSKLTDAVGTLQEFGLKVSFVKQPTLKLFGGSKVVSQSPAGNTALRRGGMVTLTVAAPPDMGALVGMVTKEPAYNKLNPEYRQYLDTFLK